MSKILGLGVGGSPLLLPFVPCAHRLRAGTWHSCARPWASGTEVGGSAVPEPEELA